MHGQSNHISILENEFIYKCSYGPSFIVKFYYFEIDTVFISKYQSKQYKLDINVIVLRQIIAYLHPCLIFNSFCRPALWHTCLALSVMKY